MKFLDAMLTILGIIGIALLVLSMWLAVSVGVEGMGDIVFKLNLLTFLTGLSYILFIVVIYKLVKK